MQRSTQAFVRAQPRLLVSFAGKGEGGRDEDDDEDDGDAWA